MGWWSGVITLWAQRLQLPLGAWTFTAGDSRLWAAQASGTFMPSSPTLTWTWLALISLWAWSHFFSDRFHPLKVIVRARGVDLTVDGDRLLQDGSEPFLVVVDLQAWAGH